MQVFHIPGDDQMAAIFTKPLEEAAFTKHSCAISGWQQKPQKRKRGSVGIWLTWLGVTDAGLKHVLLTFSGFPGDP